MRKISTLFQRDPDDRKHVIDAVTPGCEWVLAGEGVATRKFDGTCVMLDADGAWWARRQVNPGKREPDGFVLVDLDPVTGKRQGWEPIGQSSHAKAFSDVLQPTDPARMWRAPGTYELCGPQVNGNPEGLPRHALIRHGDVVVDIEPEELTFDGLHRWMDTCMFEGIVWWRNPGDPDGDMCKLKRRDLL